MVSTDLKNISQIGSFPQVGVNIKNVWNHHLAGWCSWNSGWWIMGFAVKLHPILYHQCVIGADMLSYSFSWRFPSCKRGCFTPRFTLVGVTFGTKAAMYPTDTWGPLIWSNENNISPTRYDWMAWVSNPISSRIPSLEVQPSFLYRLVYRGLISSKRY